ncbi:hypothetical protein AGDE_11455 [Angomonas deanei]|uniref:Uncharacterized protein n=1 Tax=Angomonas deanei TaxID=59799 RepID=A0A7G2C4Y7_9TRYP|nr:hypothetical protein AGDE_11455 [Angomonas deanei]CAD2214780.1 hypothetical protein, conserved [Angomonas deanei]|eukprot:EPY26270.1 hypothetical protein AGDE_11455 [Angomonas deanei]
MSLLFEVEGILLGATTSSDDVAYCYSVLEAVSKEGKYPCLELYVLCCEAAIANGRWDVAKSCEKHFATKIMSSVSMTARGYYCQALVRHHLIPAGCRGQEFSNEQHVCASYVIKGLALAVVEYPNDGWIVTVGLENLWMVVKSFFTSGKFSEVIDVVTFAVSLFDKLFSTNFDHLHVQWLIRYAKCCSGLGKFQESLGCYTTALDVAARLDDDRLYVQILRMMAVLVAERDGSSSKAKGEAIFSKQPIFQAIQCTQHFFGGYLEENAARTELTVLHEKCLTFSQERVKQEQTASRSKTKAPRGASTSEGMVISTAVMEEVISEVVLALALCKGTASTPTAVDLLLTSVNPRCKAFGMYAKAISWGYEREALDFSLATDLTYLTQSTLEHIKKCIHDIEVALDTARMIENDSERVYTLQVGCALLWLACLPLLQEPTIFHIRHTIKKMNNILKETTTNASQMRFSVELAYQSSVLEVEDDSLSKAKDCIQDALAKEYHVTLEDGRSVLPMDLPLMWLLHRADVRSKSGLFSNPEDEVLYNLEQVKLVSSASKRLVLIKAAFNKLPPLQDQEKGNEPEVNSKPEDTKHKPTKGASAKEKGKVSTVEPKPIHIRESLAYLYLSLLRECMKELSPSITPVALSVSKSLCDLDVPLVDQHKDLLLMKAEGHQCYAEVLLAESATEGEVLTTEMTTTITQNLLTASKIGCALSKMGFECAFIVMNACQKFLDLRQSTFSAGEFRSSRDLDELYEYFSQSILDFRHESKLTVELAFSFVLTLLGDYMESKDKDASWGTYEEFYQSVLKFPKSDSGSTTLKRALEVCQDTLQRLFVPSEKAPILSVYPTVCRLLGGVKVDHLHLPQELLLFQLGKICGPIGKEEKATAVSKDLLELLKSDPSVELCGRLAEHAFDMGIEQTVLDVCDIAEKLYKDGKLGWGTLYYPIDFSDKSTPVGNDKKVSLPARNPSFPKPSESDWSWYAKLLYFQAVIYGRRIPSMDFSSGRLLGLKVVQLCTNAAIATACGPAEMRSTSLKRIISFYHNEISRLRSIGVPDSEFVSSLKIIFSRTVLSNLRLATTNRVTDAGEDYLLNIVTSLGRVLLRGCAESNRLAEGVAIITSLQKILPTKYQSQISEEEVKARSQLSMPVDSTLRVAKSAGPEAEYTVWVALARTTTDPKQCENAWMCALKAVKDTPIARATCLCAYAEHLIRKGDVSCKQIKLFLLSAVDTVEHFGSVKEEETLATLPTEATGRNTLPRTLLGTTSGRTMLFSLLMGKTPIPVGKLRPVSTDPSVMLSELTIAVRAFYALFCISSDYSESDFPSKRDCVALILHYVQCMWRTVGSSLQKTNPDGEAPEDSAAPFPATWSGWCGHVVDASVVQLFTRSSREGSHTWSTDVMESIYLNVAEYLMEHKMEVFSFMILEWVKFSAALHHSPDHFKFHIVHRVANLYAQKACCLCALSAVASKSYVVEKPSAHFWASVEDGYSQIRLSTRPQEAKSERAVDMFSCSLHTLVLREAECWVYFGKTSLARLLVNATATLCRDIGDYESFCRCRTLTERMALYEHKPPAEEEDDEVLQNTPPSIWVELYLTKALHYLKSSRHVDLEGIFHKVKEVAGRFGQTDPESMASMTSTRTSTS